MRLEILSKFKDHDCVRKCLVLMHMCKKFKVRETYTKKLTSFRAKMVALVTNEGKVICFTSSAVQRYVVSLILVISSYIHNPKMSSL